MGCNSFEDAVARERRKVDRAVRVVAAAVVAVAAAAAWWISSR